ncbi:MAG: glycoside hydrolase family 38 C-terminal domain-containing protein [Bacillota bacterium]|nr:glycoside hydrolase family 38 C-terminal domain-containing protein [Bacillota bacterium]
MGEIMIIDNVFLKHLWGSKEPPYSKEWNKRIKLWISELLNHLYTELGEMEFEGFTTMEQLSYEQAVNREFYPMPKGTKWGAKWEYGWFKNSVVLPPQSEGNRIVIMPSTGGDGIVFVNGAPAGSIDHAHRDITVTKSGRPGTVYDIVIESYAGHGPHIENIGPTPPGRIAVPEPPKTQVSMGRSTYGIWEEEAFQLLIDVTTLYKILISIDEKSLRAQEISKALRDFTLMVDFEQGYDDRVNSFIEARKRLKPVLECVNGSTVPLMHIFGQSHIDLAWMWPKAETERKAARTLSTQTALIDEYPDYIFFMPQPPLYIMLKNRYPDLYQRVLERVMEGRIMPEGAMWIEADTNMPSGESLIRQFIYGKRFFNEEFGIDSVLLWLPDTFGFSAALPQIAAGCGVKYFATQKILRSYYDADPFPYNIFMWEGIDGTQILTHIFKKNNSHIDPEILIQRWESDRNQQEDISVFMFPFGYGDGGGGPTRYHIEYAARMKDLEGVPRAKMCHPNKFFSEIEKKRPPLKRYVGELYFQAHRGTYTTQAKTKRGNRKSEFALRECEFWLTAANAFGNLAYPYEELEHLWKTVLFNQFHDILPGTSIARVHKEAEADYGMVLDKADELTKKAVQSIVNGSDKITTFNSLSWDREEIIALPDGVNSVKYPNGPVLPVQNISGTVFAKIKIPSCGWVTVEKTDETIEYAGFAKAQKYLLENEYIRVTFNEKGQITSIFDKETGLETAKGLCNDFKMYKDVTSYYDAWDIDSMYESLPITMNENANMEVMYEGGLIAGIRIERNLNNSRMAQEITLTSKSRRVDFNTTIEWNENHKLLKVNFPTNIYCDEALHEIQFGHVKRPTHKSRRYDADRYEVCNHKWTAVTEATRGFALLNDCKYGVSTDGGSINLTLLKSPLVPDMTADRGIHSFTYSIYLWNGAFSESDMIKQAYQLNSPVHTVIGESGQMSVFSVDKNNIIIETVKPAEDHSGDIILRIYESMKTTTSCNLYTAFPVSYAAQTDMLENVQKEISCDKTTIPLFFRPFEIKTIRIKFEA